MTEKTTEQLLVELVELQLITAKLAAISLARGADSQAELVVELSDRGVSNPLIARILEVPGDSVRKAVTRARKARGD